MVSFNPWSYWPASSPSQPKAQKPVKPEAKKENPSPSEALIHQLQHEFKQAPPERAALFGSALTIIVMMVYRRYGLRIKNATFVNSDMMKKRTRVRGVVLSVKDGDGFQLFHTPAIGWRWPLKFRTTPQNKRGIGSNCISIRIAGVDAPEIGYFGRENQPHSTESRDWLQNRILNRVVYCELLRRDQYNRVVANVIVPRRFVPALLFSGHNLALEILEKGHGVFYDLTGAEYGPEGKERYLEAEAMAKKARVGMWKKGTKIETPAEYKRRHSQGQSVEQVDPDILEKLDPPAKKSWIRRRLTW